MPVGQYESQSLDYKKTNNGKETDEIEKYKKEIMLEGLQIEAEGLASIQKTNFGRNVLKIPMSDTGKLEAANSENGISSFKNGDVRENNREENKFENTDEIPFVREHTIDEYMNYTNVQNEFYINESRKVEQKTKIMVKTNFLKSKNEKNLFQFKKFNR